MSGQGIVRIDDLASDPPRHWRFEGPLAEGGAARLDDVVAAVAEAERQARELGRWVVVTVAYESAPAFEPAMRTKPAPPPGTAFVGWTAYERREAVGVPTEVARALPVEAARRRNVLAFPDAVREVQRRIALGEVYQVNVTDRVGGRAPDDRYDLYAAMLGMQSSGYGAFLSGGDHVVVSASPELFFRWEGDTITCRPMKGTAQRQPRPAADVAAGAALAASAKDRAENVMIVDLLRNDLARLTYPNRVRVPELFTLERYETVWQLTSTVEADVRPGTSLVDVFRAVFPCGSVTGAPKIAAMAIIDELELEPRGVYCGAIGFLSPPGEQPRAVFSVPIRTAVIDGDALTYGTGAGITWSSDPDAEDAEVAAKALVLRARWPVFELLETLRHDSDGVLHVDLHLDRMSASAGWFGIPLDRTAIERAVAALPTVDEPHRVRLLLDRSGRLTIEDVALEPAPAVVRLAVDTMPTPSDELFCCHKTTARQLYDAARHRHPRADDVILVNERGMVIETTVANLAYRLDDRWWVPPLTDGGLPGIARHIALAHGEVAERCLPATALADCEALAVLNDLRGWRPAHLL